MELEPGPQEAYASNESFGRKNYRTDRNPERVGNNVYVWGEVRFNDWTHIDPEYAHIRFCKSALAKDVLSAGTRFGGGPLPKPPGKIAE
jgi:hypothetical protein